MSVKIVDPTPDPKVIKYCTCRNCGVRLSFVPNDVKKEQHYDYTGGSDTFYFIDCPACSDKVSTVGHQ